MKYQWLETRPDGDNNRNWACSAMSGNGVHIIAGVYGGRLFVSNDSGITWTETQPVGNNNGTWNAVAMSYSGQYIIAVAYSARAWISNNYGATWAETRPGGNANLNWNCATMSWDGQTIYVGEYRSFGFNCGLWKTTNFGANWVVCGAVSNANAMTVCCSANGQIVYYGAYLSRAYRSFNSAASWTEIQPVGASNVLWGCSGCDATGEKALLGIDSAANGRLYYTKDYGATFTQIQPMGDNNARWRGIFSNQSFTNIMAGSYAAATQGRLYMIGESGLTFQEERPGGADSSLAWRALAMAKDGSTAIAGVEGGRLYVGRVNLNNKILNSI